MLTVEEGVADCVKALLARADVNPEHRLRVS
jgi:hypothetical protein